MRKNHDQLLRATITALGAGALLITMMTVLGYARTPARPRGPSDESAPTIGAITVTSSANLPISDTRPHQAVDKTVYFNNSALSETNAGEIILQFWISDTAPLTLTAGSAFGDEEQVLTHSTGTGPWRPVVTYSVEADALVFPEADYTVSTSGGERTVSICYTRDVNGPSTPYPIHPEKDSTADKRPVLFKWSSSEDVESGVLSYTVIASGPDNKIYSGTVQYPTRSLSLDLGPSGSYTWHVRAVDAVGNASDPSWERTFELDAPLPPRVYLPRVAHKYPPQPEGSILIQGTGITHTYRPTVTLILSATAVEDDQVVGMRLRNDSEEWPEEWTSITPTQSYTGSVESWLLASQTSGLRTVYAQFKGDRGGVSIPDFDRVYIALNGDFEFGLVGWTSGGAMRVQEVGELYPNPDPPDPISGNYAARLGGDDRVYPEGSVPVGFGALWQTFSIRDVSDPAIVIRYRVATHDVVYGESTGKYFDDFEVSVNIPPWDPRIGRIQREQVGCNEPSEVPETILVERAGLAFCDGNRTGDPTGMEDIYDTGWKTVTLQLDSALQGGDVKLYLANFNRHDGYWNTWTYVDEVSVKGTW